MNPGVQILSTGNTIAAALDVVVFHSSPGSFHIYGGELTSKNIFTDILPNVKPNYYEH